MRQIKDSRSRRVVKPPRHKHPHWWPHGSFPDASQADCEYADAMSEDEYRRRWTESIPAEFSSGGMLVAATSIAVDDSERFKALAASQGQTVSAMFGELISAFLDGERAAGSIAASRALQRPAGNAVYAGKR